MDEGSKQASGKSSDEPDARSSFAAIVAPEDSSESSPDHIEIWGRIWGGQTDLAAAIYVLLHPETENIETVQMVIHGRLMRMDMFKPPGKGDTYLRRLRQFNIAAKTLPQRLYEDIESNIRNYCDNHCDVSRLLERLKHQKQESFEKFARELTEAILEEPGGEYQLRGRAVESKPEILSQDEPHQEEEKPKKTADTGDDEMKREERSIRLELMHDPVNGVPVEDLEEGMEIWAKLTGPVVEQLPDHLIDSQSEPKTTIPFVTRVQSLVHKGNLTGEDGPSSTNLLQVFLQLGGSDLLGQAVATNTQRVRTRRNTAHQRTSREQEDIDPLLFIVAVLAAGILLVIIFWLGVR